MARNPGYDGLFWNLAPNFEIGGRSHFRRPNQNPVPALIASGFEAVTGGEDGAGEVAEGTVDVAGVGGLDSGREGGDAEAGLVAELACFPGGAVVPAGSDVAAVDAVGTGVDAAGGEIGEGPAAAGAPEDRQGKFPCLEEGGGASEVCIQAPPGSGDEAGGGEDRAVEGPFPEDRGEQEGAEFAAAAAPGDEEERVGPAPGVIRTVSFGPTMTA